MPCGDGGGGSSNTILRAPRLKGKRGRLEWSDKGVSEGLVDAMASRDSNGTAQQTRAGGGDDGDGGGGGGGVRGSGCKRNGGGGCTAARQFSYFYRQRTSGYETQPDPSHAGFPLGY